MIKTSKKILVFIAGSIPTEAELAFAEKHNTSMFRNATVGEPDACLEACDAVAGCVPEAYLKRYEVAKVPFLGKVDEKPAQKSNPPTHPASDPAPSAPATPWQT